MRFSQAVIFSSRSLPRRKKGAIATKFPLRLSASLEMPAIRKSIARSLARARARARKLVKSRANSGRTTASTLAPEARAAPIRLRMNSTSAFFRPDVEPAGSQCCSTSNHPQCPSAASPADLKASSLISYGNGTSKSPKSSCRRASSASITGATHRALTCPRGGSSARL